MGFAVHNTWHRRKLIRGTPEKHSSEAVGLMAKWLVTADMDSLALGQQEASGCLAGGLLLERGP